MREIATSLITGDEHEYLILQKRAISGADDGTYEWALNEIDRLREALRFYAKNHYPNIDDGPWGPNSNDWGDVARTALEGKE